MVEGATEQVGLRKGHLVHEALQTEVLLIGLLWNGGFAKSLFAAQKDAESIWNLEILIL